MDAPALMKGSRITGLCIGLLALIPGTLSLASPQAEPPRAQETPQVIERFGVAAIHPSAEKDERASFQFPPGGGFRAENASLKLLIQVAYEIRPEQISGGDKWTDSQRFDVLAKPAEDVGTLTSDVPHEVTLKRLQMLLSDRFALSLKSEPKMRFGYTLTVAKSGPKMTLTNDPGSPLISQKGLWAIIAERVPMSLFSSFLGSRLHVTVVDETGLKGLYNFEHKWTSEVNPDQAQQQMAPNVDPDPAAVEQLGLRLERQKVETDSYVIEHADTPTEN